MTESASEPLHYARGDVSLDRLKRKVTIAGVPIELTSREYAFLELFLAHPGHVLTRDRIAAAIWETGSTPETNLIDVYVLRLRRKLETGRETGPRIHTIRGVGYVLD